MAPSLKRSKMPYNQFPPSEAPYFLVECIEAPQGRHGLEGYILNETYKAEKRTKDSKLWYRVWPEASDYFETCSPNVFKKYFKRV